MRVAILIVGVSMDAAKIKRVQYACYSANATMAAVANLSPILFLTFRTLYGISFSLLGLLVLINFVTQLSIDLIFSFFSHKFNIRKTVKIIPVIALGGFLVYAIFPAVFPQYAYLGLLLGTVIISAAAGLAEVLISPVIAALPAEDPEREMSKLHAVYAWGSVGVIVVSTLFLLIAGGENWLWLALLFAVIPLVSLLLFAGASIPQMQTPEKVSGAVRFLKNKGVWLCVAAIFAGGAAECTMAQWCSGYLEQALGIPKIWGDLFGAALFAVMLGLGRTLYAKCGKRIERVLLLGMCGATVCYLVTALTSLSFIGLFACAFTGFCVSMLWPGSLVVASDRFPQSGVFIYAIMAAGGDFGAAIGPQLVGVVADTVLASPVMQTLAAMWALTPEQLGMKLGILCGMLFPLFGIFIVWRLRKTKA